MKSLLVDAGNSRLKWGVGEASEIHRTGHISQAKIREQGLQVLTTRLPRHVDRVLVSNVAGTSFATRLAGVIGAHCGCDVHFARVSKSGFGVRNSYAQPRRMGVDRWVAMIAAYAEQQSACLVVDAGTAVTLDAVDDNGEHLGGQILPGAGLMATALASSTSDIPAIAKSAKAGTDPLAMFGRTTSAAVSEGALNAVVGAIERAVRALQSASIKADIILTGGDASRILTALNMPANHRPNLVLQGLLHMLESTE